MPLDQGYGVVVGTRDSYYRDPVNDYGQYYHGNLRGSHAYGRVSLRYRRRQPLPTKRGALACRRAAALHAQGCRRSVRRLASADKQPKFQERLITSGIRISRDAVWFVSLVPLAGFSATCRCRLRSALAFGVSLDALNELEPLVAHAARVFVFGEPFNGGDLGVHNVHQNQGAQWVVNGPRPTVSGRTVPRSSSAWTAPLPHSAISSRPSQIVQMPMAGLFRSGHW